MSFVVAGIGCRKDCPAEDILAVVQRACGAAGRAADALAAPSFKASEAGLQGAAASLGLRLILVEPGALAAAQPRCVTFSEFAARAAGAAGAASVAEGCALAAAGPQARLLLPRLAGARATCALAEAG